MADTKNFLDKTGLQRLVTNLKNLFLSKTNTTQYTPTANYHPATKKYVDDNKYTLPTASSSTKGGIKVGTNLTIADGVLSAKDTTYSAATTSAAGLMSASDKTKLDGITAGANKYSLPTASSSTLGGIKVGSNLSINNGVLSATNTTYNAATTENAGLMSASDKSKLDGIASGANAYSLPTATSSVLGGVKVGSNINLSSGTISLTKANVTAALGYTPPTTNTTYNAASTTAAGLMSAEDKVKLNGIATGANAYSLPTASASTLGGVKVGTNLSISNGVLSATNTTYSAATTSANGLMTSDMVTKLNGIATGATKNSASSTTPKAAGTAAVGSESAFARGDHVHPAQTTVSGNAGSATKLATARSIALGTAVNSTATNFDGTGNITIPVTGVKEAYLTWGGTNLSGAVSPIGAALSSEHSANRIAYLNPNALYIEYSNDGGSTWTNANISDNAKTNFVTKSESISVGSASTVTVNHRTRITLTAQNGTNDYVYIKPRKMLMNVSTAGHGMQVLIERKTGASGATWPTVGTYKLNGWSGWNDIPLDITTLGGGKTQTGNNWYLRLTISNTSVHADYTTSKSTVLGMRIYGDAAWTVPSNMAGTGHLYSYDYGQNATFPASVSATSFIENGTALSSKYAAASHGTHVTWSTTTPKANGTAAVGTETKVARGDHVHPLQTSVSGNAGTATKFASAQSVALTGDVTGSASSQAGWSVATTLANSGVTAGSYGPSANATPAYGATFNVPYITVDAKGRVTSASTKTVKIPASDNSDTKVTNTLATTTKAYITGTTSATTSTGTQVFDTGVYLDTTAGMLTATTFKGALSGNATTATTATKANQLTTARTITIGAASDTFNGTDNVSFDLDDIGAASASVVNAKFTSIEADIATLFANINAQGEVTSIKTTQGWTFNNSGMNIGTTSTFNTAITTSGATFKNGSTAVTTINSSGLTATTINNQGAYQYGYANGTYLFKDELVTIDGEYAVATFYNGT